MTRSQKTFREARTWHRVSQYYLEWKRALQIWCHYGNRRYRANGIGTATDCVVAWFRSRPTAALYEKALKACLRVPCLMNSELTAPSPNGQAKGTSVTYLQGSVHLSSGTCTFHRISSVPTAWAVVSRNIESCLRSG